MEASDKSLDSTKKIDVPIDAKTDAKDKKEVALLDRVNTLKLAATKAQKETYVAANIKADINSKNNIPFFEVGKRFSFMKIAKATTMEEFKSLINEALEPFLETPCMQKDEHPVAASWYTDQFNDRSYVYTSVDGKVAKLFVDPEVAIKCCDIIRNILLSMNFTLTDLNGNADYQELLVNALTAVNTGLTNYNNNLLSMAPFMLTEMKWRLKEAEYVMYESDDDKSHGKIADQIGDEMKCIADHVKKMSELAVKQTRSNFRAVIEIVSKAGILHGREVANSYRKAMNTMLGNFEDTVKNMNSAFELKLAEQEKAANLRYDAMEARLTTEINRLEGVIKKSQELNKKYEASLSNLVGRMEKLNVVTEDDNANANLLKTRSNNLYKSNEVLSADFKETEVTVKDRESVRRGNLSKSNKIAIAATVLALGAGGSYYFLKEKPDENDSKRR